MTDPQFIQGVWLSWEYVHDSIGVKILFLCPVSLQYIERILVYRSITDPTLDFGPTSQCPGVRERPQGPVNVFHYVCRTSHYEPRMNHKFSATDHSNNTRVTHVL